MVNIHQGLELVHTHAQGFWDRDHLCVAQERTIRFAE